MQTTQIPKPLFSLPSLMLLCVWALGLAVTLQSHRWDGLFPFSICGPWGCGPRTSALVGYHSFWLMALFAPAWLAQQVVGGEQLRRIGTGLLLVGVFGVALLLVSDGYTTLQHEHLRLYFFQRCGFRLATFVDVPLVQLSLIGIWLRAVGASLVKQRWHASEDQNPDP